VWSDLTVLESGLLTDSQGEVGQNQRSCRLTPTPAREHAIAKDRQERTDHRAGDNKAETTFFWLDKSQSHPHGAENKILLMTLLFYIFYYITGSGITGGSKTEGREAETISSASSRNNSVSKSYLLFAAGRKSLQDPEEVTHTYIQKIVPPQKLSTLLLIF